MDVRMRFVLRAATAALLLCSFAPSLALAGEWEQIDDDEGIKVWKREVEGSDFVAFRGRGNVRAPIQLVAAVIRDANRETEWMQDCADAKVIRFLSATDAIVYNRTGSPVPFIADRDTVLKSTVAVFPDARTVLVEFSNTTDPDMPVKDGVVRMPTLKGHWRLIQVDHSTTDVEYQVQADPGGALPAWLVNMVSNKLPFHTVRRLRDQVKKGGYEQHRLILEAAIDWTAFEQPPPQDTIRAAPAGARRD